MVKVSAGILLYRRVAGRVEVLLGHPGGPLWARKDEQAWSIPKGECDPDEPPLLAARRELTEETGAVLEGEPVALVPVKQPSGKIVHAFAVEQDFDLARFHPGTFTMEWPPRSGKVREYPELDRVAWMGLEEARVKIQRGQGPLLDQLTERLGGSA